MLTEVSAQDQFRAAYENRYTWGPEFPGYEADVSWKTPDQQVEGHIRIDQNLKGEIISLSDESATQAIQTQLWEIGIHRIRRSFDQSHGQNQFSYGDPQADGSIDILVSGKAMGDRYQVKDRVVTLVHRHIHSKVVTIHTHETLDTGSGYLPLHYSSTYVDADSGQVQDRQQMVDRYTQVGDYYILNQRQIDSEQEGQRLLTFSNIQLLKAN